MKCEQAVFKLALSDCHKRLLILWQTALSYQLRTKRPTAFYRSMLPDGNDGSQLDLDVDAVKRAGLLHDIGKAVDLKWKVPTFN